MARHHPGKGQYGTCSVTQPLPVLASGLSSRIFGVFSKRGCFLGLPLCSKMYASAVASKPSTRSSAWNLHRKTCNRSQGAAATWIDGCSTKVTPCLRSTSPPHCKATALRASCNTEQ
eukprot:5758836-Amphidinium_carterae.1